MKVFTFTADGPALIPDNLLAKPTGPRIAWGNSFPTTGYWRRGDKCYSTSEEQPNATWTCVAEGSPGTWLLDGQTVSVVGAYAVQGAGNFDSKAGIPITCVKMATGQFRFNTSAGGFTTNEYLVIPVARLQNPAERFYCHWYASGPTTFDVLIEDAAGTLVDTPLQVTLISSVQNIGPVILPG